jgi:hypothetical protein
MSLFNPVSRSEQKALYFAVLPLDIICFAAERMMRKISHSSYEESQPKNFLIELFSIFMQFES